MGVANGSLKYHFERSELDFQRVSDICGDANEWTM